MIYVFLAEGFEETEAIVPVDILRRAEKQVFTVGITGQLINSSHGIPVVADVCAFEVIPNEDIEAIILPGGMPGTLNLEKSETVQAFIDYCDKNGKIIGAICAAPSILGHKGLLKGKKAACYMGFEEQLIGAEISAAPVVRSGNIITANGAGSAFDFGLAVLTALEENEKEAKIQARAMHYSHYKSAEE